MLKIFFINRNNPSSRIVCTYALLGILISANMSAEACPFIDRNVMLNQQTNFSISGYGIPSMFNLVTKSCKQVCREVVEFFPLIAANGQPIAKKNTDEKPKTREEFGTIGDEIMNILKDWKIQKIFLWFVFGVLCGYGFFGASRYKS